MDKCLYFCKRKILLLYINNAIVIDLSDDEIFMVQNDLINAGYDLMHEGALNDCLGVHIQRDEATGAFHLTQPKLIE